MTALGRRDWVPQASEDYIQRIAAETAGQPLDAIAEKIAALTAENRIIHERDCVNLNPATNVMNPRAEALLSAGIGARPSLGYPGDKYEMGLEAIEQIEVIAAELAAEVFGAKYAEIRVPSGAIANLYAFMAAAKAGDCIIAPPGEIGGHVTHHGAGAAGLYGIVTHPAPIDPVDYTVDVAKLRADALRLKPKLISIGGSLNLFPHPIRAIRAIADEVGALVLFDAAHMSGMIAGHGWQQPLEEGAHLMTMSTYKSLGGPPSGLIVTNDAEIARKLDAIAYPVLTANFDAAKSAALAVLCEETAWRIYGGAALSYGLLADGRIHLALDAGLNIYDYAPFRPVIEGVGGVITDWDGNPVTLASGTRVLAACDPSLHGRALEKIKGWETAQRC